MKTFTHYSARASAYVHGSGTAEVVFSGLIDSRSLAALHGQARAHAVNATGWVLDFSAAALVLPDGPVEGLGTMTGYPIAVIVPEGFTRLSFGRREGVICVAFSLEQSAFALTWLELQKGVNAARLPASRPMLQ